MTRRAFTILELTLASAIATLVVMGAFAVFTAMNKSDRRLAAQYVHVNEIERTRRAFLNTFTSLVMSDRPQQRRSTGDATNRATPVPSGKPESSDTSKGDASGGSKSDPAGVRPPPPRIVLGAADSTDFFGQTMQRLEVVLSRSPVPTKSSSADFKSIKDDHIVQETAARNNTSTDGGSQAIRGAFILRAQEAAPAFDARENSLNVQELWWVPLPPPAEEGDVNERPLAASAGYPTRLLSDIIQCRWQFFQKDEWHEAIEVTWSNDLPAYVKVTLELANGARTEWLLEVDYTVGAEVTLSGLEAGGALNSGATSTSADAGAIPVEGGPLPGSTIKGTPSGSPPRVRNLIKIGPKGEQN
ncbi:MAG: hypothetical protein AABZ53_04315 [Planctomycetota bacterium]